MKSHTELGKNPTCGNTARNHYLNNILKSKKQISRRYFFDSDKMAGALSLWLRTNNFFRCTGRVRVLPRVILNWRCLVFISGVTKIFVACLFVLN